MTDTVTIQVDQTWQEFFTAVDESFTFSNQGPNEVYVRESASEPLANDAGYVFMPGKGGTGKVESSSFWVRTKFGSSLFHHGVVVP